MECSKNRQAKLLAVIGFLGVSLPMAAQQENHDEHHHLEEVVVSALPIERTVEQLALPTSIVDGDQLARQQSTSIGEALSSELGVTSTYFGPVASRPVIRGQFGERVAVLSNGLDSLDASALSEDHATSSDTILADRVEVVRGPATLLYGSGAAGGIVNVVDSRIFEKTPEQAYGGGLSLSTDSATGKKAAAFKVYSRLGNWVGYADYFTRDTDDVNIPDFAESQILRDIEQTEDGEEAFGVLENTASNTDGNSVGLSYIGNRGYIGLSVNFYQTEYGVPGAHHEEGEEGEEEESVSIDLDQTRYELRSSLDLTGFFEQANLKIANNQYEHIEFEGAEIGTVFTNDATDVRLDFTQTPINNIAGSIGVQYKTIDFNAIGDEAFVPASKTDQLSIFAFEEYTVNEDIVVQGSARIEKQEISVSDFDNYSGTTFGGSVGAIWNVNDYWQLSTNISLTERHPNSTELYADGPHLAVQRFERGSVVTSMGELDTESSKNFDVTLRGDYENFHWSVTAFLNDIDDYIVLAPSILVEDGLQVFSFDQSDVKLYGTEAELLIDLIDAGERHLHARLFGDFVHAEQNNTGAYLPRIPPLRYGFDLHYVHHNLDSKLRITRHDQQQNTAPFELATESYTLLDFETSYRLKNYDALMFLRGSNLLDEDARHHSSPLKDIAPLPGRSLHLGLRWEF